MRHMDKQIEHINAALNIIFNGHAPLTEDDYVEGLLEERKIQKFLDQEEA